MDLQLQGQHVLITGGSKGIGLACARGFLQEGAHVSLVSRQATHLQNAMQHMLQTAAARDAQGKLKYSYAHPLFWAPFVVVGD